MLLLDAEPSRKERGHRGVRPRHPNRRAFGSVGSGFLKRHGTASFSLVHEVWVVRSWHSERPRWLRGTMWDVPTLRIAEVLAGSGPDWTGYLDSERVGQYVQNPEAQRPVVVFETEDGLLLTDGYHRVAAAQQRGAETIDAVVHHGSREDALRYAAELGAAQRGICLQDALAYIKRRR